MEYQNKEVVNDEVTKFIVKYMDKKEKINEEIDALKEKAKKLDEEFKEFMSNQKKAEI